MRYGGRNPELNHDTQDKLVEPKPQATLLPFSLGRSSQAANSWSRVFKSQNILLSCRFTIFFHQKPPISVFRGYEAWGVEEGLVLRGEIKNNSIHDYVFCS